MKNISKTFFDKPVFFITIHMIITVVLSFVIISITTTNISGLDKFITERTHTYAKDVSLQLAADITTEFETRKMSMAMVADSIKNTLQTTNSKELEEFLDRKSEFSIFDKFLFIGADELNQINNFIEIDDSQIYIPHLNLFNENSTTQNHTCIQHDRGTNLFYTNQISNNGKTTGILIGLRNKSRVQELIRPKIFDGDADSCIINTQKEIIILPQKESNLRLGTYINKNKDSEKKLNTLQKNINAYSKCIIEVERTNNENLIIVYVPLHINDWGLITFLPASNLRGQSATYMKKTIYTTIGSVTIFLVLTILSFLVYRKNKKMLQKVVFKDSITLGLNETAFRVLYHQVTKRTKPNTYTIVLMNIKNFKLINEQFGTEHGDKTLKYIYTVIRKNLKKYEFTARTEADNFFLCLKETDQKAINERLLAIVTEINSFNAEKENPFNIIFYKGAYILDDPTIKLKIAQGYASSAYRVAVEQNTEQCIFYDKSFTEKMHKEHEITSLFEQSIKRQDFKVYLQPKIRLEDGRVGGAEALVRWHHPEKGMIYPNDFIPIFEKNGKICQLDQYMFTEVCKIISEWQQQGRTLFPISVNLSRQHFRINPNFLDTFYEIAKEYNIPNNIIEFELTESIFFETSIFNTVKECIKKMHKLGFLCSLDDFGAGFSSLGLLKEFDIDTIKFDRQFFIDISTKKSKEIIGSMIDLSLRLGIHTVAEGIETNEQVNYLDSTKCDMIQGYVYSKPLCLDDFEQWISKMKNNIE